MLILFEDNKTSISLTKNMESQVRTKHIDIIHHYIWGLIEKEKICIKWILGSLILANALTKAFSIAWLKKHREL